MCFTNCCFDALVHAFIIQDKFLEKKTIKTKIKLNYMFLGRLR